MARSSLALLLLLTAAVCFAQAQPAPVYDLPTVIQTALDKHPALQAGALDVTAAQAKVRQVQAHFRPQINAEAGYTRLQDDPTFTVPGMGRCTSGPPTTGRPTSALSIHSTRAASWRA